MYVYMYYTYVRICTYTYCMYGTCMCVHCTYIHVCSNRSMSIEYRDHLYYMYMYICDRIWKNPTYTYMYIHVHVANFTKSVID